LLSHVTEPSSKGPDGAHGKRATRAVLRAQRDAMALDVREASSGVIAARASALLDAQLPASGIVALYAAKGSEVETAQLDEHARARGFRVVYPRMVDGQRELAFHEVARDELVPSRLGLLEPRPDAPAIALSDIAAFVIPGLAFDRQGGRIGWGRGYYDATIARAPHALRVALAFECQVLERIPREAHDMAVHVIITEVGTYTVG
jgi:5-formyltetrahydrofolate cyclo-ligase